DLDGDAGDAPGLAGVIELQIIAGQHVAGDVGINDPQRRRRRAVRRGVWRRGRGLQTSGNVAGWQSAARLVRDVIVGLLEVVELLDIVGGRIDDEADAARRPV